MIMSPETVGLLSVLSIMVFVTLLSLYFSYKLYKSGDIEASSICGGLTLVFCVITCPLIFGFTTNYQKDYIKYIEKQEIKNEHK